MVKSRFLLLNFCCSVLIFLSFTLNSYSQNYFNNNNFIITYSPNFPDSLKPVVDSATHFWSYYIETPVPIHLQVNWADLNGNVTAYAVPTQSIINLSGLPFSEVFYPIALAEKLLNTNLNSTDSDIDLFINKNTKWNSDLSVSPLIDQFDLFTIIIHEIAHGLGFTGSISYKDSQVSLSSNPSAYDMQIFFCDTLSVINVLLDNEVSQDSIYSLVTSNRLTWNGKLSKSVLSDTIKLYAPSIYNTGSTIYHLDEAFYPILTENALMTPKFEKQEKCFQPGIITLCMLADMGWDDYFVQNVRKPNLNSVYDVAFVSTNFNSDFIDTSFVQLLYSYDNGLNYDTIPISYSLDSSAFIHVFEHYPFERNVNYGYLTKSIQGDSIFFPSQFPKNTYKFTIAKDITKPIVTHSPVKTNIAQDSVSFRVSIKDNFDIDSSYIKIIIGRDNFTKIIANKTFNLLNDDYGYYFNFPLVDYTVYENDVIAYNIFSVDVNNNIGSFVADGEYVFVEIESVQDPINFFITDFESDTIFDYFNLDKFNIIAEHGFSNKALHTTHPYESSFKDNSYIQYSAELNYPIRIANNPATLEFDEVVLIEPREEGVSFGEYGFWDYVIVEATKSKVSDNWYPLGKIGYDTGDYEDWMTRYYSSIISDNNNSSTAVGDESLYHHRTINLLENKYFRVGDTIFIRFRLQSDFNSNAWGWAIDNLKIQERLSVSTDLIQSKISIYPNPVVDILNIDFNENITSVEVYNILGQKVDVKILNNQIRVDFLPEGCYILKIESLNKNYSIRFLKD